MKWYKEGIKMPERWERQEKNSMEWASCMTRFGRMSHKDQLG